MQVGYMKFIKNQYAFYHPVLDKELILEGSLAFQITRVLRLKVNDRILLQNGTGLHAVYRIEETGKNTVTLRYMSETKEAKKRHIVLLASLIKKDKLEWLIQKAVELEVSEIWVYESEHSVAKLKNNDFKTERWEKIIMEAYEQSLGFYLPSLKIIKNLKELIRILSENPMQRFVTRPEAEQTLSDYKLEERVLIAVGPEGDFSENELNCFDESGFQKIKLSNLILKSETAAICAMAQLQVQK